MLSTMNRNFNQLKSQQIKKKVRFDLAMTEALSEISYNLKEFKSESKRQREKADFQRGQQSTPASLIRDDKATLKRTKGKLQEGSSTQLTPTLSTICWVLECYDEQDDVDPPDLSLDFINILVCGKQKKRT